MLKILEKLNISSKEELFKTIKQFIKFGLVGVSNTIISFLVYYIFIFINEDFVYIGQTVGFFVSVLNAYFWNNRYVFKNSSGNRKKTIFRVYLSYGITFVLGMVFTFIMIECLNISKYLVPVINVFLTTPINFIINKLWAFKEGNKDE